MPGLVWKLPAPGALLASGEGLLAGDAEGDEGDAGEVLEAA